MLRELAIVNQYSNMKLVQDYASRAPGRSPYARTFKNPLSGVRVMEVTGLPMVDAYGQRHELSWYQRYGVWENRNNIFHALISGRGIRLVALSAQPGKISKDSILSFTPQLFIGGVEVKPKSETATILDIDPVNSNYTGNVLEWDYEVCKRRVRIIEGRFLGSWVFPRNPGKDISIKYNQVGGYRLKLGQFRVSEDEERITPTQLDELAKSQSGYPATLSDSATYYPDADEETSSVDGWAGDYSATGVTWGTLVAGPGWNSGDSDVSQDAASWYTRASSKFGALRRGIILFDTSALPDDATIVSAVESLYGESKVDPRSNTPNVNIYSSSPASDVAIVAGDYDSLGSTAYCDTPITYAGWSTAGYNDFTFNATGIAAVSKVGITKTGTRNVNYDVANLAPTWGAELEWTQIKCYFAEQGEGYKPKLVVTYTVPSVGRGSVIII